MKTITIRTQKEMDAIPEDFCGTIKIFGSSYTKAIKVTKNYSKATVEACGSSYVIVYGTSSIIAKDWSRVKAFNSSHVIALDSSSVEMHDLSHVIAHDQCHIEMFDEAECDYAEKS